MHSLPRPDPAAEALLRYRAVALIFDALMSGEWERDLAIYRSLKKLVRRARQLEQLAREEAA